MEDTRHRWERAFVEALDFDTWGQVEEAVEGYQRLQAAAAAEYVENVLQLRMNRRDAIGKLAAVLKLRTQELQSSDKNIGLNGMKTVKAYIKDIIVTDTPFPLPGISPEAVLGVTATEDTTSISQADVASNEEVQTPGALNGTLRPAPQNLTRGDLTLTLFIEKWSFKDATAFTEPRIAISVWDAQGKLMEAVQETPVARTTQPNHVVFDNTAYIQTPLNKLPPGAAIFLEFKHWKPKKMKKSCKAYCFIEMDEIKTGPLTLEIYKKPADYARKKRPSLLSIKPLYLHLELLVEKH